MCFDVRKKEWEVLKVTVDDEVDRNEGEMDLLRCEWEK